MAQNVKSSLGEAAVRSQTRVGATLTDWLDRLFWLLLVAGLVISGYLTFTHLTDNPIICTADRSCDTVNRSAYAYFPPNWGLPVAYLGLMGYLGLAALNAVRMRTTATSPRRSQLDLALFVLTLGGVAFSAYLTAMEIWVIHAICWWCVGSAVVITGLFALSLGRVWTAD